MFCQQINARFFAFQVGRASVFTSHTRMGIRLRTPVKTSSPPNHRVLILTASPEKVVSGHVQGNWTSNQLMKRKQSRRFYRGKIHPGSTWTAYRRSCLSQMSPTSRGYRPSGARCWNSQWNCQLWLCSRPLKTAYPVPSAVGSQFPNGCVLLLKPDLQSYPYGYR